MGALEEVLIDLILHESIQSISDLLCLRILKLHLRLNFEVLRLVILLVCFGLFRHHFTACIPLSEYVFVLRNRTRTSHWVITVVKFV